MKTTLAGGGFWSFEMLVGGTLCAHIRAGDACIERGNRRRLGHDSIKDLGHAVWPCYLEALGS